MRGPHKIFRLIRTGATFQRTGAMTIALNFLDIHPNLRFLARFLGIPFLPFGLKGNKDLPPVARALTALGPAYIKFGQTLSTRPDIVGVELAAELQVLLDGLPPFPTKIAIKSIESELGVKVDEVFSDFSEPIAAASIAQVHKAILRDSGEPVAVKVLRPKVERAFQRDVDAFYLAAWLIKSLSPASRRLRPHAVVEHFEGVVLRELDLRLEASAADEFASTTKDDEGIIVPKIHWEFSSKHVLTMDWAEGININDIEELRKADHDLESLSTRLIQLFLQQALRDGFFHADQHPGNLKVNELGEIITLDFGIMGRINTYTRRVYAEILYGFINQDYHRVAEVHFEAGYVPPDQDLDDFAQALRSVTEPILGMDASHISMGRLLSHLFEVTERFGMETRTELILLQRTMVVIEGVARSLNPKLNMWDASKPVVEDYIRKHVGPVAVFKDTMKTIKILSNIPPQLPDLLNKISSNLESVEPTSSFFETKSVFVGILIGIIASILGVYILTN
ncbi:MAG: 2-polyprenylphenol 6-hydroxylase [Paracoccaceae bacterium]|nr:2-polyprenylphenol 6-hydroxylase [Paracoccaceae bacterium]